MDEVSDGDRTRDLNVAARPRATVNTSITGLLLDFKCPVLVVEDDCVLAATTSKGMR
jgi:hypothetical protein